MLHADVILPVPKDGKLRETVENSSTVTVWLTDKDKNIIDAPNWPKSQEVGGGTTGEFYIPKAVQLVPNGYLHTVYDVKQRVTETNPGATADLEIEALYRDPLTGQYLLGNIFGAIADKFGMDHEILIPDLFADTNGGGLGEGDVLYSIVDLNAFMVSLPSVSLADTYNVVDGLVTALPGMQFSTTPFVFDRTAGFVGTAYTGPASVDAYHGASGIPEPTMAPLLAGALIGFSRRARR